MSKERCTPEGKLHISRENLRRKILAEDDLPVEVGSLADIEKGSVKSGGK